MIAYDINGNQILIGRLVLNTAGQCFVVQGLDEYEGTTIVLTRPFKEEYLFPVGLQWSHHPEKELTMVSEEETTMYLLKNAN